MAHDVFISYSSKDKNVADAACALLERKDIRVWIAPRDILPGMGWGASLVEAIGEARVMVLVFSGAANASPQIEREVERAVHRGLPIIPFRVEEVPPSGSLEFFINAAHWLDAFTKPLEQSLDRLADVVKKVIEAKYGQALEPLAAPSSTNERASKPEPAKAEQTVAALLDQHAPFAPVAPIPDGQKSSKRQESKLNKVALVALALGGLGAAGGLIYSNQPHAMSSTSAPSLQAQRPATSDADEALANGAKAQSIKDYAQAMIWRSKAAGQGNAVAQTIGLYGYSNSPNKDQDANLKKNCGDFTRVVTVGTFEDVCHTVQRQCKFVCDWQGNKQQCTESAYDGSRVAFCN